MEVDVFHSLLRSAAPPAGGEDISPNRSPRGSAVSLVWRLRHQLHEGQHVFAFQQLFQISQLTPGTCQLHLTVHGMKMNDLKEVIYRAHQIDKLLSANSIQEIKYLLNDFKGLPVTPEILQETDLVRAVYRVLKTCPDADTRRKARNLLSVWKKLYKNNYFQEKGQDDRLCTSSKEKSEKSNKINEGIVKTGKEADGTDSTCEIHVQQLETSQIMKGNEIIHNLPTDEMLEETRNEKQLSSSNGVAPKTQHVLSTQAVRAKCVELLFQALIGSELADDTVVEMWKSIAKEIEQFIHTLHLKNDKRYKACIRSKIANLKNPKNPHLRQKILSGEVTPQMFAEMSVMDMANEELKQQRASYTTSGLQDHQLPHSLEGTKTNKIRCRRCERFNCTVTAIARGTLFIPGWVCYGNPDEQMMTFVICNECGEKWYNSGWISV
ncbi:transcription elongation factor A N-terminal and central domain-containing protein isoform X2 [Scyliorhinus torazame]|uniref:transcription elongation factor A N-terminal and central domain-containing protein isoform X2 n=1 Tax=Scyliorhinus torazame TaxID=75743 RepID=UPI003B5A59DC